MSWTAVELRQLKLRAAYLYQRIHQSLSISQSLVNSEIIAHFVIYKWHLDDLSRISDSAQRPFTSPAAPAPLVSLEDASFSGVKVETGSVLKLSDALHYCDPKNEFHFEVKGMLWKFKSCSRRKR